MRVWCGREDEDEVWSRGPGMVAVEEWRWRRSGRASGGLPAACGECGAVCTSLWEEGSG